MNDTLPNPSHKARWHHAGLFISVCIVTLLADLVSKWWVFDLPQSAQHITAEHPAWLWVLQEQWRDSNWIVPQINPGAAWSIGSGTPWIIVALTIILVPLLAAYYWFQMRGIERRWEHLGFALIIGGALGNAWDRLISAAPFTVGYGGVRDFIHCDLNAVGIPYIWPTFNLADSGITIGLIVIIIASLFSTQTACSASTDTVE